MPRHAKYTKHTKRNKPSTRQPWQARLTEPLGTATTSEDTLKGTVILRFSVPTPSDSTPLDLSTLPDWNITSRGQHITRPFGDFWGIVSDTLMESPPRIHLHYGCTDSEHEGFTTRARLLGLVWGGEDTLVYDGDTCHYLHLELKLEDGEFLGRHLCDCDLEIRGRSLPEERFRYAYCDRFGKGDKSCSFDTYLAVAWRYGRNKAVGRQGEVCRASQREKGTVQQYCNFVA